MKFMRRQKIETKNHFSPNYAANYMQIYINRCIVCKGLTVMVKMPLSETELIWTNPVKKT